MSGAPAGASGSRPSAFPPGRPGPILRFRSDQDPRPGPGVAASLGGCFAAVLLGMVLLFVPLFAASWGGAHCEPVPACQQAASAWLRWRIGAALVPMLLLGFSVRALLHWVARCNALGADQAGGVPWQVTAGFLAALAATVLYFSWM